MATKFEKLMRGLIETRSSWDAVFLRNVGRDQMDYDVLSSPYSKSDLVYTCVSTTARAVSQVPLLRYEQRDKDEYEPVYTDDPWQSLLDRPNPLTDGYRFLEAIVSYYLLDGDAFVVPFPPMSMGGRGGVPEALYVVGEESMKPQRNEKTGQLAGWTYQPKGESQREGYPLKIEEVLHFKTWNPDDLIMGMSPLEAGGLHVKVDYKASIFNEKFFDNAAVPAGMITTPAGVGFGDKKRERLRAELESVHTGYRRAFRLMFLEKGLKYEKIGATHQEMMFKDLRYMSRESIMQAFGMKKAVISVTEDLNYATAEAQKQAWWEDTLLPIMSMISHGFTHFIMGPESSKILRRKHVLLQLHGRRKGLELFGEELHKLKQRGKEDVQLKSHFDFDISGVKALQEDFSKKVETATKLSRMGFTSNEINQRLELGFDEDKPWRDSWWVQQAFVPVGEEFGQEEPEKPPVEEPEVGEGDEDDEQPVEIQPAAPAGDRQISKARQLQWTRFTDRMSPIEGKFQGKIERFFWEIRRKSLRYLLKYHDPEGLMREEFDEETRNMVKWVRPLYREALAAGIRSASEEVVEALTELEEQKRGVKEKGLKATFSIDVDFLMDEDPEVLNYLMERIDRIGVGKRKEGQLTETVRRQIVDALHEGMSKAESISELADRIKGKLKGNVSRAKTIARTETISAANHGRNLTIKRSGFTRKLWITSGDELVRDTHRAMEAHPSVEMDEPWIVGGCSLRYPCDYEAGCPSETINCRCTEAVDPDSHPAFQEEPQMVPPDEEFPETSPAKEKVSSRIDINKISGTKLRVSETEKALRTIDKVHGMPMMEKTKLVFESMENHLGVYNAALGRIGINADIFTWDLKETVIHEVGHMIDNRVFGYGLLLGSADLSEMKIWRKAIEKSDSFKHWKHLNRAGQFNVPTPSGKMRSVSVSFDYLKEDILKQEELWARSYVQYVATKTKNKALLEKILYEFEDDIYGYRAGYWSEEDFKPIYRAIENLLREKGLIE